MQKPDNQRFNDAINFLKKEKGIRFVEIYEKIGITKAKFHSIKRGYSKPNGDLLKKIASTFPETISIIESDKYGIVENSFSTEQKLIQTQEELIAYLKAEIEKEKIINKELRNKLKDSGVYKEKTEEVNGI